MDKIFIKYKMINGQPFVRLDTLIEAAKTRNNRTIVDYLLKIQDKVLNKISKDENGDHKKSRKPG